MVGESLKDLMMFMIKSRESKCDQIGRFLKVIGNNFPYKNSPIVW